MPRPQIVRPELGADKRSDIEKYLGTQWKRAKEGRQTQIDSKLSTWTKAYQGIPLEGVRTVPFYKSSNLVVPLIRIFLDTFQARTLNIIYATKPIYIIDALPREMREATEMYLNRKALYDWRHYYLTRDMLFRGNKNGTVAVKSPYLEQKCIDVNVRDGQMVETPYTTYDGPAPQVIPYEDYFVYPITANYLEEAEIIFHRIRYVREKAERLVANGEEGVWMLPEDKDLETYLHQPRDVAAMEQQSDAGLSNVHTEEITVVECTFRWELEPGKFYHIIGVIEEESCDLFDVYFNPYPRNHRIYSDYRPFPREDLIYGESLVEILGQAQEEASSIHNDRRNNSTIASSVIFKRRNSSLIPNPSTNWYPGKVFDLDAMDDLDVVTIGRNYADMIPEEDYCFSLAEKLSGIGETMQGNSSGGISKRGVYNTVGTISMMQEGNQRQDTNIRNVRCVLGAVARTGLILQGTFAANDPLIVTFDDKTAEQVRAGLAFLASEKGHYAQCEVKASDAGVNKEIERMNLMQTAQILNQYGQTVQGLSQQLMDKNLNPGMRMVMNEICTMQKWMAERLLKQFDEWDATEVLPDVAAAVESVIPGGSKGAPSSMGAGGQEGMDLGSPQGSPAAISRPQLESLAQMPTLPRGPGQPGSMAAGQ